MINLYVMFKWTPENQGLYIQAQCAQIRLDDDGLMCIRLIL
jgi:hypothetical protein